jgi:hypothetical protein
MDKEMKEIRRRKVMKRREAIMNQLQQKRRSRGLGDTVEKVIKKVTGGKAKTCGGCAKRRDKLNKIVPYKEKPEATNEGDSGQ